MTYKTTVTLLDNDNHATEEVLSFYTDDIPTRDTVCHQVQVSKWAKIPQRKQGKDYPFCWHTNRIDTVNSGNFKLRMAFQEVHDEL